MTRLAEGSVPHLLKGHRKIHIGALIVFSLSTSMVVRADDHVPFGPWDAGEVRPVDRQGQKGISRAKHPVVGDPSKVPGEGPPSPALRPDPDVSETALIGVNRAATGLSSNPLYLLALFYRHLFTKIDGPRCQHLPTCSRFANQAVARHGVVGIMMGLDRVIQPPESSSVRTLPQVEGWGSVRHLDPVDNYEFWKDEKFQGFPAQTEERPLETVSPDSESSIDETSSELDLPGKTTHLQGEAGRSQNPAQLHRSCEGLKAACGIKRELLKSSSGENELISGAIDVSKQK
jgi:hypothetical protein